MAAANQWQDGTSETFHAYNVRKSDTLMAGTPTEIAKIPDIVRRSAEMNS